MNVLVMAQPKCNRTSVGLIPISDLGTRTWKGFQGGLYPGGSNSRPFKHNMTGQDIANQIVPLNVNGIVDSLYGKVLLLTIGMSNAGNESQQFLSILENCIDKNPFLKVFNGAQGGQTALRIIDASAYFWLKITQKMNEAGLSDKQVQIVWFKEADADPADSIFPNYANRLRGEFKTIMNVMKARYPNLKLCYLSSRIYGGYASSSLNPEPYAYYSGWAVKWTIEDQINGDASLRYSGINPNSPWLSWGPYIWADGTMPNKDGLNWICSDFTNDGTHPNIIGSTKVANILFKFFTTDETTIPWFLKRGAYFKVVPIH
jgi:hypothetical protein